MRPARGLVPMVDEAIGERERMRAARMLLWRIRYRRHGRSNRTGYPRRETLFRRLLTSPVEPLGNTDDHGEHR